MDGHRFLDRIIGVGSHRRDALLAVHYRSAGAEIKRAAHCIARGNVNLSGCSSQQSEPTLRLDFKIDRLRAIQIVTHYDRQKNLITFSEHAWRIVLDKEWLKGFDFSLNDPDLSVFGRA